MKNKMSRIIEKIIFYSVKISGILLILLSTLGIYAGGAWSYTGFIIVFFYYYLAEATLDLIGVGSQINAQNEFDYIVPAKPSIFDKYGITFYALSQILCVPLCLYLLTFKTPHTSELIGGILSLLFSCGSIGGLAGHDLIHRRNWVDKYIGLLTLSTINYAHFAFSHVFGHHRAVGLKSDWSTAYYRESLYHFLYRAICHGYVEAWRLENLRHVKKGKSIFNLDNQMIQVTVFQIAFNTVLFLLGGHKMMLIHFIISFFSICFLEIVNYVSHYGLTRTIDADGRAEKITSLHSWESSNKISNWFMFNTGKHCHHHKKPSAMNYELILAHDKTMIVEGLQVVTIISMIPPLYYKFMDKMILENSSEQNSQASYYVVDC